MSYLFNSILYRHGQFDPAEIKRTFLWMRSGFHPQAENPRQIYAKEEFLLAPVTPDINAIFYFVRPENSETNGFYEAFKWMYDANFLAHVSNASRQNRQDYLFYGFIHNDRSGPLNVGMKYENSGYEVRFMNGFDVSLQKMEGSELTKDLDFRLRIDKAAYLNEKGDLVDAEGFEKEFNGLKRPYDGSVFIEDELGITTQQVINAMHEADDQKHVLFSF